MNTIELLKILREYPLFTLNDIAKVINKEPDYVKTLIYRLRKRDLVYRIERNKYTIHSDVFIFASYIYYPSYISLWTALRYYNLTEQLPRKIYVMTPRSKKYVKLKDVSIEFIKTKHFFGFKKERYMDFDIFVAELEKVVIDSLLTKKVPLDEIIRAIKVGQLDKNKIVEYAIKIKNKALIKRLGFILEESSFNCEKLKKFVDNNYVVLDFSLRKEGKKNKKWKIIDNRR